MRHPSRQQAEAPVLFSIWCIWATVKLHRIESNQATADNLRRLEGAVEWTSIEIREFKKEVAKARRDEELTRLFRH